MFSNFLNIKRIDNCSYTDSITKAFTALACTDARFHGGRQLQVTKSCR